MDRCPDRETLTSYGDGALAKEAAVGVAAHLDDCPSCRALADALGRTTSVEADRQRSVRDFVPPARIGRYVVGELLGAGGMGVVYAAHDPDLDRKIALKILGSADANDRSVARMQREARAIAKLSHPNVIAVHDVGVVDGHVFLAMEFADGGTLRGWLKQAPRGWREVIDMYAQAGRGLAAAHAAGLVHRDFKPDNVLLDGQGHAKVADFGLARAAAEDDSMSSGRSAASRSPVLATTMTKTGAVIGTPAYMAPEQLRGDRADPRADVFAFCVALHEAIYGVRPFVGATLAALLENIEAARIQYPATMPDVPGWLREAIARGLSVDPGQRPASMEAVVASLERDQGSPRRKRLVLAASGAGAAAIAVAIVWSVRTTTPPPGAAAATPAFAASHLRRVTFEEGCEEYPSFLPDGHTIIYDAYADGADRLTRLDLATGAHEPITADDAWRYHASVSPDGKRVVYSQQREQDWSLWVMAIDGTGARELAKGEAEVRWSPDGRAIWAGDAPLERRLDATTLAVTAEQANLPGYRLTGILELEDGRRVARLWNETAHAVDRIVAFPPTGGPPVELWHGDHEEVLERTADGKALVISKTLPTGTHELWRVPLDGGAAAPLGAAGIDATKGLAFSPDHRRMVWSTCATESLISTVDGTGSATPLFPKHEWNDFDAVGVAGTSKLIALSDRGGTRAPWVLDRSGHDPPRVLDVAGHNASDFTLSPDKRWFAFTSAGRGVCAMPLDGSAPPHCPATEATDRFPAFSRDGTRLYFHTKRDGQPAIYVVPLVGGAPERVLADARIPATSPTADLLVFRTPDGGVNLLDLVTRRARPLSPHVTPGVHTAHFSEDGARVAVTNGDTEIVEVDVKTGEIVSRFATHATPIKNAFYLAGHVAFTATVWRGDLWAADVVDPR